MEPRAPSVAGSNPHAYRDGHRSRSTSADRGLPLEPGHRMAVPDLWPDKSPLSRDARRVGSQPQIPPGGGTGSRGTCGVGAVVGLRSLARSTDSAGRSAKLLPDPVEHRCGSFACFVDRPNCDEGVSVASRVGPHRGGWSRESSYSGAVTPGWTPGCPRMRAWGAVQRDRRGHRKRGSKRGSGRLVAGGGRFRRGSAAEVIVRAVAVAPGEVERELPMEGGEAIREPGRGREGLLFVRRGSGLVEKGAAPESPRCNGMMPLVDGKSRLLSTATMSDHAALNVKGR